MAAAGAGGAPVRHRRADQGRVSRVEPGAVRRDASRPGRAGVTVPAIDRRGAGRDRPPRPSHGARSAGQVGLVEIARRIARKMERSTETIRTDPEGLRPRAPRPGDLRPLRAGRWTRRPRARSICRYRMGVSVEVLAAQFGRTRSSIYRVINEMRARRILETKLEFMPHPSFDDPAAAAAILGPDARRRPTARRRGGPRPPRGCPPTWPASTRCPLLDREQEAAPVPQDELPEVPGQPAPRQASTRRGPRPPTSTRSSGSRKRPWPSRTRSSAPTCGWSSRSPSGTSARRTTSSSWSPTATCP